MPSFPAWLLQVTLCGGEAVSNLGVVLRAVKDNRGHPLVDCLFAYDHVNSQPKEDRAIRSEVVDEKCEDIEVRILSNAELHHDLEADVKSQIRDPKSLTLWKVWSFTQHPRRFGEVFGQARDKTEYFEFMLPASAVDAKKGKTSWYYTWLRFYDGFEPGSGNDGQDEWLANKTFLGLWHIWTDRDEEGNALYVLRVRWHDEEKRRKMLEQTEESQFYRGWGAHQYDKDLVQPSDNFFEFLARQLQTDNFKVRRWDWRTLEWFPFPSKRWSHCYGRPLMEVSVESL